MAIKPENSSPERRCQKTKWTSRQGSLSHGTKAGEGTLQVILKKIAILNINRKH